MSFAIRMDDIAESAVNIYCFGCLCSSNEYNIQDYKIKYAHIKAIFKVASIRLCYLCKRIAQNAELFIQNVQSNQILLENCLGDIYTTIREVKSQLELPTTLSRTPLTIIISGNDYNDSEVTDSNAKVTCSDSKRILNEAYLLKSNDDVKLCNSNLEVIFQVSSDKSIDINNCIDETNHQEKNIKLELKEEDTTLEEGNTLEEDNTLKEDNTLEEDFLDDNNDFQDPFLKEENDFPLKELLKNEIHIEDVEVVTLKTSLKKKKGRDPTKKIKERKIVNNDESSCIETVYITEEQCLEERKQLAMNSKYTNSAYKCKDCIKGFSFKASYEVHMEKHSLTMGAFLCDICKLRTDTEEKLHYHKRCHTIRFKCVECGIQRTSRLTIKEHISAYHRQGEGAYVCPYCSKDFKRQVSQKKHVRYTHLKKERVICAHCHKSYASKDVLKGHIMLMHPKEVSAPDIVKKYPCEKCDMSFRTISLLKAHGAKHSLARDFFCVECDKAFKSEAMLKQHLKTQIHVKDSELPLACLHCNKKFGIRRSLDRHMNRVHLHIKPFRCDKCDKAYVTNWSLILHKRTVHEGYRRPLRYPCKMCDKVFDRNSNLKIHMRTHTGERPYQCSKCPAEFSQASSLATHDKLVHLKLTRDGRPKPNNIK